MNQPYDQDERFNLPNNLYRVTAGIGGESFLIDGGSQVAIYDCGMAYCASGLIENIKAKLSELGHDSLDMILVSHTHYDHIGALPYLLKTWPDMKVYGATKLEKVFSSDGARKTMERLGISAREKYLGDEGKDVEILTDPLRVDHMLHDGELFNIGKYEVSAFNTPGHTDCSMVYLLKNTEDDSEPSIAFLSESTGVLEDNDIFHTSILKSYQDTINSAAKCKNLNADILIGPHFGLIPDSLKDDYFDMYVSYAEKEKDFILDLYNKGLSFEEILDGYEKKYWTNNRVSAQPRDAFIENAGHTIRLIINTFGGENGN